MKMIFKILGVTAAWTGLCLAFVWLVGKRCEPVIKDIEQHGLKHKVDKIWYGADGTPVKVP
jgi:hypothetical protein